LKSFILIFEPQIYPKKKAIRKEWLSKFII